MPAVQCARAPQSGVVVQADPAAFAWHIPFVQWADPPQSPSFVHGQPV
jgi:hypothetical protein